MYLGLSPLVSLVSRRRRVLRGLLGEITRPGQRTFLKDAEVVVRGHVLSVQAVVLGLHLRWCAKCLGQACSLIHIRRDYLRL